MRTATVAHALLRAVAGSSSPAREARQHERRIVRSAHTTRDSVSSTGPDRGRPRRLAPAELRRYRCLGARRGARSSGSAGRRPRAAQGLPTEIVAQRLERERGLGPWSGVVCLEGLGRYERGLARDLGLVKLASALWSGRQVEAEESDALLEPYGEWAGLASVYLLAGYHAGLVGLHDADRNSRDRQDRRGAARRAA